MKKELFILSKQKHFSGLLVFLGVMTFFTACKKDIKEDAPDIPGARQNEITAAEQAYPGLTGELSEVRYGGKTITVEKKGNRYVWLGDVAFDQATYDSLQQLNDAPSERTYKYVNNHVWSRGRVYYTIQSGFSSSELIMINNAITHWQNNTSLVFVPRTVESNYITFVPGGSGSGLYSDYIGMKGGQQIINLQTGAFITGNVIHEIGHTIGFYHEQCRTDRGNAINVNYNNVFPHTSSNIYQFQTYAENNDPGGQLGAFDFGSIMLYSSFAFSDGVHPVMTRLNGTTFNGQRTALSTGDIETANFLYGPPFARIEYDIIQDIEEPDDITRVANIYIAFYSNAACTTPLTLSGSKTFHYGYQHTTYYSSYNSSTYTNYYSPTLSGGSSRYLLASNVTTYDRHYDYGNIIYGEDNDYFLLDGFRR